MPLTTDELRAKQLPSTLEISAPELGEGVTLLAKRLGVNEYIALNHKEEWPDEQKTFRYFLRIVRLSLINPDGSPLLDDALEKQLTEGRENIGLVNRIGQELLAFNFPNGGSKKNSMTSPSDSSPTASASELESSTLTNSTST